MVSGGTSFEGHGASISKGLRATVKDGQAFKPLPKVGDEQDFYMDGYRLIISDGCFPAIRKLCAESHGR